MKIKTYLILSAVLFSTLSSAQDQQTPFTLTVSTRLVIQTVAVTDKSGKPLEGLTAEDFTVTEDNVPQTISIFEFQKLDDTALPSLQPLQPTATPPARDFAAELLHFSNPVAHPLATRWTRDAVREFAGSDSVPDAHEARDWLLERIAGQGIYRDRHWWADLVLATAYVGYFRAMTGGTLGSDFTRAATPEEQLRKLLGIDAERPGGRSRVRKAMAVH